MRTTSMVTQQALLQQIVSESGIINKDHQQGLKKRFQQKLAQHVSMVQYHRLREDRFALSQKKVLDRQNESIEKTKEYIQLRQNKANYNKSNSLIQKSRRVEEDLNRWERVVEKNRKQQESRIQQSIKLIREWNDKISQSSSSKNLRQKGIHKVSSRQSISSIQEIQQQKQAEKQKTKNPEESKNVEARYSRETKLNNSRKKLLRVSTESMHDRKKQIEEQYFQKHLTKTGQKQERINEARFIKHYMMDRKNKLKNEKERSLKKQVQRHLHEIKEDLEARNQLLDQKYKNQKVKVRDKRGSLPLISGSKATDTLLMRGPGEQWRVKIPKSSATIALQKYEQLKKKPQEIESARTLEPSYNRLMMDKLKDVAVLMRKGRKF